MGQVEYLRFLVAANDDTTLRRELRKASHSIATVDDLVGFARRFGYRFHNADVPMAEARAVSTAGGDGLAMTGS